MILDPDPHSEYGSASKTAIYQCGSGSTTLVISTLLYVTSIVWFTLKGNW
jgi:hypothetical protein